MKGCKAEVHGNDFVRLSVSCESEQRTANVLVLWDLPYRQDTPEPSIDQKSRIRLE